MDYLKEYRETRWWFRKVVIMNLLHTAKKLEGAWSIYDTAQFFDVSMGLVSENLRLAKCIDTVPGLDKAENRQKALQMIERRKYPRNFISSEDTI